MLSSYLLPHASVAQTPPIVDPKHLTILRDLQATNGTRRDGIITVAGIKVREYPDRVIETINEVILRQDYDFFEGGRSFVMIDVGMNVAISTLLKASSTVYRNVYGFEPLRPTYDIAKSNIDLNPQLSGKIDTFNIGLSDADEELEVLFTLDEIMSTSSEGTFDSCFPKDATREKISVRRASDTLGPIIGKHEGESIFLKIDCEGAEFKILPDLARSGLLKKISVVIVEWHHRDPSELLDLLTANGFFYFVHRINVQWNVGIIKAIRVGCT